MAKKKIVTPKLTARMIRFCDEYLVDLNGTQAAIRAGYSEKTAGEMAFENLKKPQIQAYIKEKQAATAKKLGVTSEMVKLELKRIGFSNVQDYFDGDLIPKDLLEVPKHKARAISSIKKVTTTFEGGATTTVEFKLYDKVKALELLGKHLGFFEKDNEQLRGNPLEMTVFKIERRKKP